jgi:hypothetical protein
VVSIGCNKNAVFCWRNEEERDRLEDLGVVVRKMDLKGMEWDVVDQIYLADRDKCQTFINTVMNVMVPSKSKNFFAS